MNNEQYKREYRETLNSERRFIRFFFQVQITVLIVAFILMHDTRWYDTNSYKDLGMSLFIGALFILHGFRIYYLHRVWPKWFHSVEEQYNKENNSKPNILLTIVKFILYMLASLAMILVITILPAMYFPDRYEFLPIVVAINLLVIIWIYSMHNAVVRAETINLFHGYIPELALIIIFGIVLPYFGYEFIRPNAFDYTTAILVTESEQSDESPLNELLKNYNFKTCDFMNPCSSIAFHDEGPGQTKLEVKTSYRSAYFEKAHRNHKRIIEKIKEEINDSNAYRVLLVNIPTQNEYKVNHKPMKDRPIISIYSLMSIIFVWFFAVYWKGISGRAYKVIADYLKMQGVEV